MDSRSVTRDYFILDFGKTDDTIGVRMASQWRRWSLVIFLLGLNLGLSSDGADEVSEFSYFEKSAIQKLRPGAILSAKGDLMDFERGISSETCFLVAHSIEKVLQQVKTWDQTPYSDLGIFIQGTPGGGESADFSKLNFIPSLRPVSKFIDKNKEIRSGDSPVHLSVSEAQMISAQRESLDANRMTDLWKGILSRRLAAYKAGGIRQLPPYDACKVKVSVAEDVKAILEEQPTVSARFKTLFDSIFANKIEGYYYWQMINVDGTAVLVLGTIYERLLPSGARQVVDLQWYVSGGYYTAFTCYELHPLQMGQSQATLVWRGDYTSISMKQLRKGVERLFSVNIMVQEIKKSIRFFLEDINKK